jgi:hypothetical protein
MLVETLSLCSLKRVFTIIELRKGERERREEGDGSDVVQRQNRFKG